MTYSRTPVLGFCAYGSNAGKTTLMTSLIPLLNSRGLRISVIKHAHHSFDIDHPGKDSFRLREAGAVQVLLGSRHRWALMTELSRIDNPPAEEPSLADFLSHVDSNLVDLIMAEGFKSEAIPKIEIFRPSLNNPLLADSDKNIIAIASDAAVVTELPVFDLNNPTEIAEFIMLWAESRIRPPGAKIVSSL